MTNRNTTYIFTDEITNNTLTLDIFYDDDPVGQLNDWHGNLEGVRPVIADLVAHLKAGEYAGEEAACLQVSWEPVASEEADQ